jgi:FAD/FMN-containing dehydrogenase
VDEGDTAYSNRRAAHNVNINGVWLPRQKIGDEETEWTRAFFAAVEPYQTGRYINFLDRDDQGDALRAAFSEDTYRRLSAIKDQYDPDDIFRLDHSIRATDRTASRRGPAAVSG